MSKASWEWQLNKKSHQIELRGGGNIVMDFVRYGMNRAAPRFNVNGLLHRADEFGKIIPGEEHHAAWRQTIDNPTACLIAAAPDLLEACKVLLAGENMGEGECQRTGFPRLMERHDMARAAIAKAEGLEEKR